MTLDLDRVAVYYLSSDGGDWALYLQSKLGAREYRLDTYLNDLGCDPALHRRSARLNLFLITPDLLEKYDDIGAFLDKFEKRNSLLILTGTELSDLEKRANKFSRPDVLEWLVHEMRGEEESVRVLMVTIIGVYEGHMAGPQSPALNEEEGGYYDVLPPKTRQVNHVQDILQKNDMVYVLFERLPEGEVIIKFPFDDVKPEFLSKAAVFCFNCSDMDSSEFQVLQDGTLLSKGHLEDSEDRDFQPHPKTFATSITQTEEPDCLDAGSREQNNNNNRESVNFYLEPPAPAPHKFHKPVPAKKPGIPSKPGKTSESKLERIRELLEEELDPQRLLCQCLGIEKDSKQLDEKITAMVESAETLRHLSFPARTAMDEENQDSTWPTLLHFGAEYNLENFCDTLLSNPLLYNCCAVANKDGQLPHQLAQLRGHTELAEKLKIFLKFVQTGKSGGYDSGFPSTPRLSTISQYIDQDGTYNPPPEPHKSGYVGIPISKGGDSTEEDYLNEAVIRSLKVRSLSTPSTHHPNLSMTSEGFSGSIEEQDEDESPLPSPHDSAFSTGSEVYCIPEERDGAAHLGDPFDDMMDISKHPAYDASSLSRSMQDYRLPGNELGEPKHKRKDLAGHLGIQVPSPGSEILSSSPSDTLKKKSRFHFFKKKPRSNSEPALSREDFNLHLRKKPTVYTRTASGDVARSSGTSSTSSASTISVEENMEDESKPSCYLGKNEHGHLIRVGNQCWLLPDLLGASRDSGTPEVRAIQKEIKTNTEDSEKEKVHSDQPRHE